MKPDEKYNLWDVLVQQLEANTRESRVKIGCNNVFLVNAKAQRDRYPKPKEEKHETR